MPVLPKHPCPHCFNEMAYGHHHMFTSLVCAACGVFQGLHGEYFCPEKVVQQKIDDAGWHQKSRACQIITEEISKLEKFGDVSLQTILQLRLILSRLT